MSLDPRTLKQGDVVIFGGKVEKTVKHPFNNGNEENGLTPSVYFKDDYYITWIKDPIWDIAELKKPEMPPFLVHIPHTRSFLFHLVGRGDYETAGEGWSFSPNELLVTLKSAVAQLEEAGVKE